MPAQSDPNPYSAPSPTDDWKPPPQPPVGSVLVQGLRICGNRWMTIAAVIAIFWGPIELVSSFCEYELSPADQGWVFLVTMALEFVGHALATAAVIAIAVAAADGMQITVAQSLATSFRVFLRFSVTYFLCTVMILIGMVFFIVPGLYLMVVLSLVDSVVVQEGKWGASAIGRSYDLASRRFWLLLGLGILFVPLVMSPWFLYWMVSLVLPIGDSWMVDAAADLSVDAVGAYPAVCLYLIYRQSAHQDAA